MRLAPAILTARRAAAVAAPFNYATDLIASTQLFDYTPSVEGVPSCYPSGSMSAGNPNGKKFLDCYPYYGSNRCLVWNNEVGYFLTWDGKVDPSDATPHVNGSPYSINGSGNLLITAKKCTAFTYASQAGNKTMTWTSGAFTTGGWYADETFAFQYGFAEARARIAAGRGLWSAPLWLFHSTSSGDNQHEFDLCEVLGQAPSTIYTSDHASKQESSYSTQRQVTVSDAATALHRYGVLWTPTGFQPYLDGVPTGAFIASTASAQQTMYLLCNLAVGGAGSWPGATDGTTPDGASMEIAHIRVWQTADTVKSRGVAALKVIS